MLIFGTYDIKPIREPINAQRHHTKLFVNRAVPNIRVAIVRHTYNSPHFHVELCVGELGLFFSVTSNRFLRLAPQGYRKTVFHRNPPSQLLKVSVPIVFITIGC